VEPRLVQDQLRLAFGHWGRPGRLRVDNGRPWGSRGDFPTELALWLAGLGVGLIRNPPRRPERNGVVERSQGVGKVWCMPWACATAEQLQATLEEMDRVQREEYPASAGRGRLAAFPAMEHSGRGYDPGWEEEHWDFGRACAYLGEFAVVRRVDRRGFIYTYNRNHYVGKIHQGKHVYVMFDLTSAEWMYSDESGRELRREPAREITTESILGLSVTRRE
jgi:hypothetical protein